VRLTCSVCGQTMSIDIEVRQWDGVFQGGWFCATAVRRDERNKKVLLRYHTEADGAPIQAWAPSQCVRQMPPSASHGWAASIQDGAPVHVARGGGFWLARIEGRRRSEGSAEASSSSAGAATGWIFTVRESSGTVHVVGEDELRPAWLLNPDGEAPIATWREARTLDEALADDSRFVPTSPPLVMDREPDALGAGAPEAETNVSGAEAAMPAPAPSAEPEPAAAAALAAAAAALPPSSPSSCAAPSPDWVQLGSEVEFSDASGAWCSGELLSLLDAEGAAASAGGAAVTAVVKSRLAVSAGPYSAGKLLLLRTRVPVADLRPRPPPPPPSFLSPATVGSRLQLRFEGAWWEVELRGVLPAAGTAEAPGGEGEGVEGEGGAAGESAATGEGGAAAGEGGAQERSPAARESRYCVASERHPEVGGEVRAPMLRPAWVWEAGQWRAEGSLADGDGAGCREVGGDGEKKEEEESRVRAGSHEGSSAPPALRGAAPREVSGLRVRVWDASSGGGARRVMLGTAVGYAPGMGLCVSLDPVPLGPACPHRQGLSSPVGG